VSTSDFVRRGLVFLEARQYLDAVKVCRLGLLGAPTELTGRIVLGRALMELGRHDEVLAEMRAVLEIDREHVAALTLRGAALLAGGDAVAALEMLSRAGALDPHSDDIERLRLEAQERAEKGGLGYVDLGDSVTKHYPGYAAGASRDSATTISQPVPIASRPTVPLHGSSSEAATRPVQRDSSSTIEIDPEIDGVEFRDDTVARGQAPAQPVASSDFGTVDLSPADLLADSVDVRPISVTNVPSRIHQESTVITTGRPAAVARDVPTVDTPLSDAQVRSAAALEQLFPESGRTPPTGLGMTGHTRDGDAAARESRNAAAKLDLGKGQRAGHPAVAFARPPDTLRLEPQVREESRMSEPAARTTGSGRNQLLLLVALGILFVVTGVVVGLYIRKVRLERQLAVVLADAEAQAETDTLVGWSRRVTLLEEVARVQPDAAAFARVFRARAAMAAEFSHGLPEALASAARFPEDERLLDVVIARAYLTVATGDRQRAEAVAPELAQLVAGSNQARYLLGRIAMLEEHWPQAIEHLTAAAQQDARPAYLIALARAESRRHHWGDALVLMDKILGRVPDHPGALIVRAKILAASGRIRRDPSDTAVVSGLEQLLAESGRPLAQQARGVSTRMATDAGLALAQVQLERGDRQGAQLALERARQGQAADPDLIEEVVVALVAMGHFPRAEDEARRGLAAWPSCVALRVALARAQFTAGRVQEALSTLQAASTLEGQADGLALRGQILLASGDIAAASRDFDSALAQAAHSEPAVVGRAWIDLSNGDFKAALARLQPLLPGGQSDRISVLTVHGAALRRGGDNKRARELLRLAVARGQGAEQSLAYLELGRLERSAGNYEDARVAYAGALAGHAVDAKLEAAALFVDLGDLRGARETILALAKHVPANPQVVLEAARICTLAGDLAGAREQLRRAGQLASVQKWQLARELGRLTLHTNVTQAVRHLEETVAKEPGDFATHLMLLDAYLAKEDLDRGSATLDQVLKRFPDRPERYLASARVRFARGEFPAARQEFLRAKDLLVSARAAPRTIADAWFGIAQSAYAAGDGKATEDAFAAGLKLDPASIDSVPAYVALGDIAADRERLADALAAYGQAVQLNPEYANIWFQVGRIAHELGKSTEARAAMKKYLALEPGGESAAEARAILRKR
jgi:tetratricopeptide (TPR) repeat protein